MRFIEDTRRPMFTSAADTRRNRRSLSYLQPDDTLRYLLIACAVIVLIACVTATVATAETLMYVVTREDPLVARERPSKRADPVAYIDRGECIEVEKFVDGWAYSSKLGEGGGYASTLYLSPEPPPSPTQMIVSSNGRVHVREKPGADHIRWAHDGDAVTVYGWITRDGVEWALLSDGYIMADYLTH